MTFAAASPYPALIMLALALLNMITALYFWSDKQCARQGLRRVPEARLLLLAFLGGTPAAYASRRLFRHKTRKQPFSQQLHLIAAAQVMMLGAVALTQLR